MLQSEDAIGDQGVDTLLITKPEDLFTCARPLNILGFDSTRAMTSALDALPKGALAVRRPLRRHASLALLRLWERCVFGLHRLLRHSLPPRLPDSSLQIPHRPAYRPPHLSRYVRYSAELCCMTCGHAMVVFTIRMSPRHAKPKAGNGKQELI